MIRFRAAASAFIMVLAAPAPAQQPAPQAQTLANVFGSDAKVEQFVISADGRRTYYAQPSGGIWLYDRENKTTTKVVSDAAWDLGVSAVGDALVYTRTGDKRRDQYVWIQPLAPATGLPSGAPRALSRRTGDAPAVSPDGKWVAFARDDSTGVGQSVVVVPAAGGAERVLVPTLPSSIAGIRWTPDSKTLYIGVNPPVPFTCAESCLSMNPPPVWGTIRRVSLAGGPPVVVVSTTATSLPGLSPDGKLIVYRDTTRTGTLVIADTTGRRLQTMPVTGTQRFGGWLGASLLSFTAGNTRRVGIMSVQSGEPRAIYEGNDFMLEPSWSSDGRTASYMRFTGKCELRVTNADGTSPRTITLTAPPCFGAAWTTGDKSVVYTRANPNGPPSLVVVDAANGSDKELRVLPSNETQWALDGDNVVLAELGAVDAGKRRVTFSKTGLDGSSARIREVALDNVSTVTPIDRTRALVMGTRPRDFRVTRIDGGGPDVMLLEPQSGFMLPRATLSANRQWVVFRQDKILEVVSLDGRTRRRVELAFFIDPGAPLSVSADGKSAVVVEKSRSDGVPGIYFVDLQTRNVRQLMSYTPLGRWPEVALSPDGRTLLYMMTDAMSPVVTANDFSQLVK